MPSCVMVGVEPWRARVTMAVFRGFECSVTALTAGCRHLETLPGRVRVRDVLVPMGRSQ